jgi:hypothetical protein
MKVILCVFLILVPLYIYAAIALRMGYRRLL